jgi:Transposase IS116/IS110/IS902 family
MPGIGPRTGSRILAEICHGTRFVDGDKLASYAGLAPVTHQSGKSINGESKSRRGKSPPQVKNAMFLAAFASRPGVQGVLRPKASRGQTPQRRSHLPGPPTLQGHPGHAPHPPARADQTSPTRNCTSRLTRPENLPEGIDNNVGTPPPAITANRTVASGDLKPAFRRFLDDPVQ